MVERGMVNVPCGGGGDYCALEVDAIEKERRHALMEKDVTREEAHVEEVGVDEADGKEEG